MTTTSPILGLVLYNSTTDQSAAFSTFRADIAGISSSSNFYKLDTAFGAMDTRVDSLEAGRAAVVVDATYVSANYYEATVASITAYSAGMSIALKLDTDSAGTVTLNINALGIKSVMKVNSSGTQVNISAGELQAEKFYLFVYTGTVWEWANATSSDQIYVVSGITGNFIRVSSDGVMEDSGYDPTDFAVAAKGVTNGDSHDHSGGDGAPIKIIPEDLSLTGVISPTQITSDQNNYNPSGLSTSSTLRISSDAIRSITGLSGGSAGRIIILENVGSFAISLLSENASSTASNRFSFSADVSIPSNGGVIIKYDSTSSRWRSLGGVGGNSGGGGSVLEVQVFS